MKDPLGESVRGVPVKARATIINDHNEHEDQNEMMQSSNSAGVAYFTSNIPLNAKRAEFTVSKHLQYNSEQSLM